MVEVNTDSVERELACSAIEDYLADLYDDLEVAGYEPDNLPDEVDDEQWIVDAVQSAKLLSDVLHRLEEDSTLQFPEGDRETVAEALADYAKSLSAHGQENRAGILSDLAQRVARE